MAKPVQQRTQLWQMGEISFQNIASSFFFLFMFMVQTETLCIRQGYCVLWNNCSVSVSLCTHWSDGHLIELGPMGTSVCGSNLRGMCSSTHMNWPLTSAISFVADLTFWIGNRAYGSGSLQSVSWSVRSWPTVHSALKSCKDAGKKLHSLLNSLGAAKYKPRPFGQCPCLL